MASSSPLPSPPEIPLAVSSILAINNRKRSMIQKCNLLSPKWKVKIEYKTLKSIETLPEPGLSSWLLHSMVFITVRNPWKPHAFYNQKLCATLKHNEHYIYIGGWPPPGLPVVWK